MTKGVYMSFKKLKKGLKEEKRRTTKEQAKNACKMKLSF
jgi:hypothetical protein